MVRYASCRRWICTQGPLHIAGRYPGTPGPDRALFGRRTRARCLRLCSSSRDKAGCELRVTCLDGHRLSVCPFLGLKGDVWARQCAGTEFQSVTRARCILLSLGANKGASNDKWRMTIEVHGGAASEAQKQGRLEATSFEPLISRHAPAEPYRSSRTATLILST